MYTARCILALLALSTLLPVCATDIALGVRGDVKTPLKLTLAEIKSLPTATVTAKDHNGTNARYDGIPVAEILRRAGVPQGEALRGESLQLGVIVKAADGYKALFALAELDPAMTDKQILLAFRRNGTELDATAGPLRIVVADEKRQARWVRQVTELEVIRVGGPGKSQPDKHP